VVSVKDKLVLKHRLLYLIFAISVVLIVCKPNRVYSQSVGIVNGRVVDENSMYLQGVNVTVIDTDLGASTDFNGEFSINVVADKHYQLAFSYIGYSSDTVPVFVKKGSKVRLNVMLHPQTTELSGVTVKDTYSRVSGMNVIDPNVINKVPTATGGVESIIKTLQGVASSNELSSQYSVRGGSFDENLVYVNDIEIYRPFLISSGNQEGLSFLNSSLVSSLSFSAGGFEAKYGDKMSSVLDINYKKPVSFQASADFSLLGANMHFENRSKNQKLSYIFGARYKTNARLLRDTTKIISYQPVFFDIQSFVQYQISPKFDVSFLGYYSDNLFKMIPVSDNAEFGTLQNPLRLKIYYEGQELDKYTSGLGGLTFSYKPNENLLVKWIASAYKSSEIESYDILGEYLMAFLEDRPDENDSIEIALAKGIGAYRSHARNMLDVFVSNFENRVLYLRENSKTLFSVKIQNEQVEYRLKEWKMIDSAGYSVPYHFGTPGSSGNLTPLESDYYYSGKYDNNAIRISAFAQNTWEFNIAEAKSTLNVGVRSSYFSLNKQITVSPRISFSLKPNWEKDIVFRFATGLYHQPPFFKEFITTDGLFMKDVKAQEAIHFILGSNWHFNAANRPFIYTVDVFYKKLSKLTPYEVDNVRIKYHPELQSKGYAYGIDMKLTGEFVKGVDSWISVSFLNTKEDIQGDFYYKYFNAEGELVNPHTTEQSLIVDSTIVYPGYLRRPRDQRVTASVFFQDYLPMDPSLKFNIALSFGTGFPTGAPNTPFHTHVFKIPPYFRIDAGLTKQIIGFESYKPQKGWLSHIKSLWVGIEVLNVADNKNIASYNWIRVDNRRYAVPNRLTQRQFNVKIGLDF
jgi:hypothetical protein